MAGSLLAAALAVVIFRVTMHLAAGKQTGAFSARRAEASVCLGEVHAEDGLRLLNTGDGSVAPTNKDGVSCVRLKGRSESYIYFALDPALKTSAHMNGIIHVEFLAPTSGRFDLQYDGYKFGARPESVYSDTPIGIHFDGWPQWHQVAFEMTNARLENRQNNGADFRLRVSCPEFYVRRVALTELGNAPEVAPDEAGSSRER